MTEKIISYRDLPVKVQDVVQAVQHLESEFGKHNPSIPVSCTDAIRQLRETITRIFYVETSQSDAGVAKP